MRTIRKVTYFTLLLGICITLILALGWGISYGNPLIAGIMIIIAICGVYLVHRQVSEVMTDDLSDFISGKAAIRSLEMTIVIGAIIFTGSMIFYFTGGWGSGMHTNEDGSASVGFFHFFPHGTMIYEEYVYIPNISDITGEDLAALEWLFGLGYRYRDAPFFCGLAFGCITVLLAGFYAAFSVYYDKKYET